MTLNISRASSVIIQRVPPGAADQFLALQEGFTRAVEAFPGYQGTEVYPPTDSNANDWVVVISFADTAALQGWLDSSCRSEWVEKLRQEIGEFRLETRSGGFGSWFTTTPAHPEPDEMPPSWKMVLTVLLGLYPTVILLTLTVGRITEPLGLAIGMLIGNALSVLILQYAVMPVLTHSLSWWLRANSVARRSTSIAGVGLIVLLLAGLAILFRNVTG